MAKFVIIAVVSSLIAFVQCAPQFQQPRQAFAPAPAAAQAQPQRNARFQVVEEHFDQTPNLEYNFDQKFASGETFNEEGKLKKVISNEDQQEREVIVTKGSYTIIDNDGSTVVVNYTADENGFHPEIVTQGPGQALRG